MTARRALRVRIAQRLRSEGASINEIAEVLGIGRSSASELLADPDERKKRERRRRYAGVCVDCGAATDGGNGRAKAPKRCHACAGIHWAEQNRIWTPEALIATMHEFAQKYGRPPTSSDWNYRMISDHHASWRAQMRRDGWPSPGSVQKAFGSWNAGIRAAGYEPIQTGKHTRTQQTKDAKRRPQWATDHLLRLHAQGLSAVRIARRTGYSHAQVSRIIQDAAA